MSTNLFTAEQEAFLRKFDVDTSLPIFPLSCEIAAKAMFLAERRDRYEHLLNVRKNGGMKSESEYKKLICKEMEAENMASMRFPLMVIALIFGGGLGWILTIILMAKTLTGDITFAFPKGSWLIIQGISMFLVYKVVGKLECFVYRVNHHDEISNTVGEYTLK